MKKVFLALTLAAGLLSFGCASRKEVKTIKIVTCTTDGETIKLEGLNCEDLDGYTMYFTVTESDDSAKTIIMGSAICDENGGKMTFKVTEDGHVYLADSLKFDDLLEDMAEGIEITEIDGNRIIVLNGIGEIESEIKIIKVKVDEETSEIELEINGKKYVLPDDLDKLKQLEETKQEPEGDEVEEGPPSP